jgi:hypothetical protein
MMAEMSLAVPVDAKLYNRAVLNSTGDDGDDVLDGVAAAVTGYLRSVSGDTDVVLRTHEEYNAFFDKIEAEVMAEHGVSRSWER